MSAPTEPVDPNRYSDEVEAWLTDRDHPLDDAIRLARDIILAADGRVTESIKWKTPTFEYRGNIVSISPAKKFVGLMFHRGAEIPGRHPRMEGDGRLVRTIRLEDRDEVESARADLTAIIQAWCSMG